MKDADLPPSVQRLAIYRTEVQPAPAHRIDSFSLCLSSESLSLPPLSLFPFSL